MNVVKLDKKHRRTFTTLRRSKFRRRKSFLSLGQMTACLLIALLIVGQHLNDDNPVAIAVKPLFENPALATPTQVSKAAAPATKSYSKSYNKASTKVLTPPASTGTISCNSPRVIDGDTIDCGNQRIRLASIDTPEMPGHCAAGRKCVAGDPYAAKTHLSNLTRGSVECKKIDTDKYGRTVARCTASGKDISCEMVRSGHAIERYGRLSCSDSL